MVDLPDGNRVYCDHFGGLSSVRAASDANGASVEKYSYDVVASVGHRHRGSSLFLYSVKVIYV
jgi:hypothetical protein